MNPEQIPHTETMNRLASSFRNQTKELQNEVLGQLFPAQDGEAEQPQTQEEEAMNEIPWRDAETAPGGCEEDENGDCLNATMLMWAEGLPEEKWPCCELCYYTYARFGSDKVYYEVAPITSEEESNMAEEHEIFKGDNCDGCGEYTEGGYFSSRTGKYFCGPCRIEDKKDRHGPDTKWCLHCSVYGHEVETCDDLTNSEKEAEMAERGIIRLVIQGHRPDKLGGYKVNSTSQYTESEIERLIEKIQEQNPDKEIIVLCGGAQGADWMGARVALRTGRKYILYMPNLNQDKVWPQQAQKKYQALRKNAYAEVLVHDHEYNMCFQDKEENRKYETAGCMQARNIIMADEGDMFISVWNRDTKGGTANFLKYAYQHHRDKALVTIHPDPEVGTKKGWRPVYDAFNSNN